jgi:hypothetical protein
MLLEPRPSAATCFTEIEYSLDLNLRPSQPPALTPHNRHVYPGYAVRIVDRDQVPPRVGDTAEGVI